MKKHIETEVKVGIFVSVGLGLIMLAILVLGGQSLFERTNHYRAHFDSIDGLIAGSKVTLGGIPVGTVESVEFDFEKHNICVQFSVTKKSSEWLRADSRVEIATQGVLGDKYLSIIPGSPSEPILSPGSDIENRPSQDISHLVSRSDQLIANLNSASLNLDRILRAFNKDDRSDAFFKGITTTARNMGQISDRLNHEIDQIQLKRAIAQLNQIFEKINNGTGTIGALINDPGLYDQAKALLGGANRSRIIRNLVRQTIKKSEENESPSPQPNDGGSDKK